MTDRRQFVKAVTGLATLGGSLFSFKTGSGSNRPVYAKAGDSAVRKG